MLYLYTYDWNKITFLLNTEETQKQTKTTI
jgi:hypothetical protein